MTNTLPQVLPQLPRVCLYTPDGTPEWYSDCVISDSLIPDLSFEGTRVDNGYRVRVVTSLAYKIERDPVQYEAGLLRACNAIVPWRPEKTA